MTGHGILLDIVLILFIIVVAVWAYAFYRAAVAYRAGALADLHYWVRMMWICLAAAVVACGLTFTVV